MISERTRDKMSAARCKGKWIGGNLILEYDLLPEGRGLVVNEEEAARVREIYAPVTGWRRQWSSSTR